MAPDKETRMMGAEVDATMSIWDIHKNLCEEMVPHEIKYVDCHGKTIVLKLTHPLYMALDDEEV